MTVSLRLTSDAPCPDCSGTGARAGTMPRVCPDCDGVGHARGLGRRRVHDERDLPDLPRSRPGRRRPVPDLPRLRAGHVQPDDLRRGSPPASRTASGSGCAARAPTASAAVRPATSTSPCKVAGAPAVRPQGRQPDPHGAGQLRRGGAGRGDQGAHARRRPGHPQGAGRHPQRPVLPGPRTRGAAQGRPHGRPAGHRRGAGPGPSRRPGPRRRRGATATRPPEPTCAPTSSTRAPPPAVRHERAAAAPDRCRGPTSRST